MTRADRRVDTEGDKVAKTINSGAKEVEAWAKIGYRGRSKGLDGGVDGVGLCSSSSVEGGKGDFASKDWEFFGRRWKKIDWF